MKVRLIITLLLINFALTGFSQTHKIFLDINDNPVDSTKALKYILYRKISDSIYSAHQYLLNDAPIMTGYYKDENLKIPNGKFIYYRQVAIADLPAKSNQKNMKSDQINYIETTGEFNNGKKYGTWINYSLNGYKRNLNTYKNNELNGLYELYSDDNIAVIRGNYIRDKREGEWYTLSKSGKIIRTEFYQNGKIIKSSNAPSPYKAAVPPEKLNEYLTNCLSGFINKELTADILVNCAILTTGKLVNPSINQYGPTQPLNDKLVAVLNDCPLLWTPVYDTEKKQFIEDKLVFVIKISDGTVSVSYSKRGDEFMNQFIH